MRAIGLIAALAGAIGVCCGLPILLSVGIGGAVAGWSVRSWGLVALGLVLAAAGWARWTRGGRHDHPRPTAPADGSPAREADIPTDGTAEEATP